jgi:hypothetical protein
MHSDKKFTYITCVIFTFVMVLVKASYELTELPKIFAGIMVVWAIPLSIIIGFDELDEWYVNDPHTNKRQGEPPMTARDWEELQAHALLYRTSLFDALRN